MLKKIKVPLMTNQVRNANEENANVIACIVVEKKKQCTYETYVELCRFAKPYGIESEECDFLDNLGEPISAWYDHFPKMVAWQYAPTFPKENW